MRGFFITKNQNVTYRYISRLFVCLLSISLILSPILSHAQSAFTLSGVEGLSLPQPGAMVTPSPAFIPPVLKGLIVHPEQPFQFDFVFDGGDSLLTEDEVKEESEKLIKYFLASLTMPEDELWVNLSPYEKDRIIPDEFGKTEMGCDLLAQDYLLKQLTASMIYPEDELGKKFWDRVYTKAQEKYGTSEIPVNTFNKVWIIPDKAVIYENGDRAFIVETHMKVMLEEDYLALEKNSLEGTNIEKLSEVSSSIIREIIIPEIEKEVNHGKNFAKLRQIYHSFILAAWYKKNLYQSVLSQKYADQKKVSGLEAEERDVKDKIYQQYLIAFEKGVYNFIKEDYDETKQEMIPRKYFSGGVVVNSNHIETQKRQLPEFSDNTRLIATNFLDPTSQSSPVEAGAIALPSWFDGWKEAAEDYLRKGTEFSETIERIAVSPNLFPAEEKKSERARRWFIYNSDEKTVNVYFLPKNSDHWYGIKLGLDNNNLVVLETAKPWEDKERENFERSIVALGSFVHGTTIFNAQFINLVASSERLEDYGPQHLTLVLEIDKWANNSVKPSKNVITSAIETRSVSQEEISSWKNDLLKKPSQIKDFLRELEKLPSTKEADEPENRKKIMGIFQKSIPFFEAMQPLLTGEKTETPHQLKDVLGLIEKEGIPEWDRLGIKVNWNVEESAKDVWFQGNVGELGLLFENVINNAINWAEKENKEITFRVKRNADVVNIAISDNGPGGADLSTWDNPLPGASRRNEGYGIGLPTIKYLAKTLGATIEVDSPKGIGTTVTIHLPVSETDAVVSLGIPTSTSSPANLSELNKGGIDFNPNYLDIQSQGDKVRIPFSNNPSPYQNIEINGLVPFIFNITPITDIPLLLGQSEEDSGLSRLN